MKRVGLISKVVPVLKKGKNFVRNPTVITDRYVEDGGIVYGEFLKGEEFKKAREFVKSTPTDFELLDKAVNDMVWTYTNLMPGCLIKSIDGIRLKKKFFWDQTKLANRHWLAVNMATEAFLGFHAFNNRKLTGSDVIDFVKYRQLLAKGHPFDDKLKEAVLPRPIKKTQS